MNSFQTKMVLTLSGNMNSFSRVVNRGIQCLNGTCIIVAKRAMQCCRTPQNLHVFPKTVKLLPCSVFLTQQRSIGGTFNIKQDDGRFYLETKEGVAQLIYSIKDGIMHIKHTRVPRALSGHGIGKLLAKAALEYGVQRGLIINITCGFVKNYVEDYEPKYLKYIM